MNEQKSKGTPASTPRGKNSLLLTVANYGTAALGLGAQAIAFHSLGLGRELDAYYAASVIPSVVTMTINNTQRNLLIPLFSGSSTDREQGKHLTSSIIMCTVTVSIILAALLYLPGSFILEMFLPGFAPETLARTTELFPFFLATIPFSAAIGTIICLLLSRNLFFQQSLSSVIPGVTILLSVLTLLSSMGVMALVIGSMVGLALQLAYLAAVSARHCPFPLRLSWSHPELKPLLRRSLPILGSTLANRSSLLFEKSFASFLSPGAVSITELARKITNAVGQSVTNLNMASFPEMSRLAQEKNLHRFRQILVENQKTMYMVFLFLLVAFLAVGEPSLRLLTGNNFESPGFSVREATTVVAIYFLVSCGAGLAGTMTYCFYALTETKTVSIVVIVSLGLMGCCGWFLTPLFGLYGLAAAALIQHLFVFLILSNRAAARFDVRIFPREAVSTYTRSSLICVGTLAASALIRNAFFPESGLLCFARNWIYPFIMTLSLVGMSLLIPLKEVRWAAAEVRKKLGSLW